MTRTRSTAEAASLFEGYAPLPGAFDEFVDAQGKPHPAVAAVVRRLDELGRDEFRRRRKLADATFLRGGVTFSVYSGDAAATERIFPFDLIPRVVAAAEWEPVRRGLEQRISALNLFLADVYGDQRILDEGHVPRALVEGSKGYCKPMRRELVQGCDLFVDGDRVWAKTTHGLRRVDVVYRRVDDAYLDPEVFRADSLVGVPGLVRAYAKGNVALVNAIGNGVADDKGIYPFVPDMIRFYLGEEPILPQVQTYVCARESDCRHVIDHIEDLVVKAVNEAGGYGMLMGPSASQKQCAEFRERIRQDPRNYIAQPRIELSGSPTWTRSGIQPRRVDLRPFVVTGKQSWVLPGGLTRVALVAGSYVVNSSQGGGSKDTWVVGAA